MFVTIQNSRARILGFGDSAGTCELNAIVFHRVDASDVSTYRVNFGENDIKSARHTDIVETGTKIIPSAACFV